MAVSATVGHPVFTSVKINRIQVWSPVQSQGNASTCSVLFPVADQSPPKEYSDSSMSTSFPAYVDCRPPPRAICGFWNDDSNNNTLFVITCPTGSIVDVSVSLVMRDGNTDSSQATLVGAVTGVVYYPDLDSLTKATGVLAAVGLTSL